MLIKCSQCSKGFPLNPDKHTKDTVIYCPWCRSPEPNPAYKRIWKPNLSWIRIKLERYQQKSEAIKILDRYFRIQPVTDRQNRIIRWEYSFTLSKWMEGKRPTISEQQILMALGPKPTAEAIRQEMEILAKHGVKIPQWIEARHEKK